MFQQLMRDESGVIISAELVLVLTIAVLAMVVGLSEVAVAVNTELNDISNAIGALDQTFRITGFSSTKAGGAISNIKNAFAGSRWDDGVDDCDSNDSCDLVCGAPNTATAG